MSKSVFGLACLVLLGSATAWKLPAKDRCSSEIEGLPLADVWEGTNADFRKKFGDRDSVFLLVGKMDMMGNFTILRFFFEESQGPMEAGFYTSSVNDEGTPEFRRAALSQAEPLFNELKAMKLDNMKSREVVMDTMSCPPLSPNPALYFVETRYGKSNRFGFYGYSYKDKRYSRIMEIMDAFRTSKN